MKTVTKYLSLETAVWAVIGFLATLAVLAAFPAQASGNDQICQVTFSTVVKGETARKADCTWGPGTVLLMQCSDNVYASASSPRPGNTFPDAGTLDFKYNFLTNADPVPLFLNSSQQHVTVLGVSDAGVCTFGAYSRRF